MAHHPNRKAIVLSGFITAFILTLAAGGYLLWQGLDATSASAGADTITPVLQTQQAAPVSEDPSVAAYQAQIEEAYRALEEAYGQIETLQAAQIQTQAQSVAYEHDDDEYEHEHEESEGDEYGQEHERRGESYEHDDD